MSESPLRTRTRVFAVRVARLIQRLRPGRVSDVIGRQLLRSATSVAANYRAACRGRSRREFIAKLGIVEEEADESAFWLEFLVDVGVVSAESVRGLVIEANELLAMTVSSIKTARGWRRSLRTPRSELPTATPP